MIRSAQRFIDIRVFGSSWGAQEWSGNDEWDAGNRGTPMDVVVLVVL